MRREEGEQETNGRLNHKATIDRKLFFMIIEFQNTGFLVTSSFHLSVCTQTKTGTPVKRGEDQGRTPAYCYNCSRKGHHGHVSHSLCLVFHLTLWFLFNFVKYFTCFCCLFVCFYSMHGFFLAIFTFFIHSY